MFLVREYFEGNDGNKTIVYHEVEGVIREYAPQAETPDGLAEYQFTVAPTGYYAKASKRNPISPNKPALTIASADAYYNIETGQVWLNGYEQTREVREDLGLV